MSGAQRSDIPVLVGPRDLEAAEGRRSHLLASSCQAIQKELPESARVNLVTGCGDIVGDITVVILWVQCQTTTIKQALQ